MHDHALVEANSDGGWIHQPEQERLGLHGHVPVTRAERTASKEVQLPGLSVEEFKALVEKTIHEAERDRIKKDCLEQPARLAQLSAGVL